MIQDVDKSRIANAELPKATPAMIEAGVGEFRCFNYDFDDEHETVRLIWEAMCEAWINSQRQSG